MRGALPAKEASLPGCAFGVASLMPTGVAPSRGASRTAAAASLPAGDLPAGGSDAARRRSGVMGVLAVLAFALALVLLQPREASSVLFVGFGGSKPSEAAEPARPVIPAPGAVEKRSIERFGRPDMPDIMASYPAFGIAAVDRDIEDWMRHIVARFEEDFGGRGEGLAAGQLSSYGLTGTYEVESPSRSAVSVTFELWLYTGQNRPGQDVITLNYSFLTGQRLGLYDIFEDVKEALAIMSGYSRKVLAARLGGGHADGAILDGTAPDADNFANLALVPGGVRVHFQPYQVARWEAGCQTVDIPLDTLAPARPLLALWGR